MTVDQRERNCDLEEAVRAALDGRQAVTWTSLPGIIVSYDPATLTASVQLSVKISIRAADGSFTWQEIAPCLDVPVQWPQGGNVVFTFPLAAGDEVLVQFCSRCLDGWFSGGDVQIPSEPRFHDLSDAVIIPGIRSQARPLGFTPSTANAQLSTVDGTTQVEVAGDGSQVVTITAPGGLVINGDVTVNGLVAATGEVSAQTASTAIPLSTHLHGGVTAGGANTGVPIP